MYDGGLAQYSRIITDGFIENDLLNLKLDMPVNVVRLFCVYRYVRKAKESNHGSSSKYEISILMLYEVSKKYEFVMAALNSESVR